jgi:hypothetical protein
VVPDAARQLWELREMIAATEVTQAAFRTNHLPGYLDVGGTLPADKLTMLATIDEVLARGELPPLRPEDLLAL